MRVLPSLLLVLATGPALAAHSARADHEVKAAFLYNAVQFTEWPAGALRGDTLNLCIAGDDAVARALPALANKTAGMRKITVVPKPGTDHECHVAYLADPMQKIQTRNKNGLLTVSSSAGAPRDLGTALVLGTAHRTGAWCSRSISASPRTRGCASAPSC